jgi:RimJ/RimL family protein N-acetyltransferase
LAALLVAAACSSTDETMSHRSWPSILTPPETLDTPRVHLEPLQPRHVEWDYAAFMGSRRHLRETLGWGDWPSPDFTEKDNLEDLTRHWKEFQEGYAYAYTVQDEARTHCVGCIYINPIRERNLPVKSPACTLAFWVIEPELSTGLDRHLLASCLDWFKTEWPFESVVVPIRRTNARGLEVARTVGLREIEGGRESHRVFVWDRASR